MTADPSVVPLGYFGDPERDGGGLIAFSGKRGRRLPQR
jgi:hypothetical protein